LARKNNQGENRYGVTHAFELKTAETLGGFAEQLRQHTEHFVGLDQSFSAMNLGFAKMELDIHGIKEAIESLRDPVVHWRTLAKYGVTIFTSIVGSALFWDIIRARIGF